MGIDLRDVVAKEKVFHHRMSQEKKTACQSNISYNNFIYTGQFLLLLLWLILWIVVDFGSCLQMLNRWDPNWSN